MGGGFDLHWRSCLGRRCMLGAAPAGGGGRMEDGGGSERRILLRLSRRLGPPTPTPAPSLSLSCSGARSPFLIWPHSGAPETQRYSLAAPGTPPYLARFSPPSSPLLFFTTPLPPSLTCLSTHRLTSILHPPPLQLPPGRADQAPNTLRSRRNHLTRCVRQHG